MAKPSVPASPTRNAPGACWAKAVRSARTDVLPAVAGKQPGLAGRHPSLLARDASPFAQQLEKVGREDDIVILLALALFDPAQERGVVGETPNLVARLQALAAPNALVIGEATRRQIGGLFDLEDLGAQQLAGFTDPQRAWRVLGESGEVSRFEALRSGETPLVGREEEVELLVRRWQQAKSGEGPEDAGVPSFLIE